MLAPTKRSILVATGVALTALVVALTWRGHLEWLEVRVADLLFRQRPESIAFSKQQAQVEIRDCCIEALGQWPWPRRRLAELIGRIRDVGARVVGVDLLLEEPSADAQDDGALEGVLRSAGGVYLAAEVNSSRQVLGEDTAAGFKEPALTLPIPRLAAAAAGVGLVNVDYAWDNVDGILRKMPLGQRVEGRVVPSLSLAVVSAYLSTTPRFLDDGGILFESRNYLVPTYPSRVSRGATKELTAPLFERSAYVNYDPQLDGNIHIVCAHELLQGRLEDARQLLEGRLVLVGVFHSGLDLKLTPFGQLPGVRVQANLVKNLLEGSFLRRLPLGALLCALLVVGGLATLVMVRLRPLPAIGAVGAVLALWVLLAWRLFVGWNYLLDVVPVVGLGGLVVVSLWIVQASMNIRRRMRTQALLVQHGLKLNAVIQMAELTELVLTTYRELTGADGAVLIYQGEAGTDQLELEQQGSVPDWVLVSLSRKKNQAEALSYLGQQRRNVRLEDVPNLAVERFGTEEAVLLPLVFHDGATGWVAAVGEGLNPSLLDPEERDYWLGLSLTVRNALENARLYKLATVDGLTGLYVRHFFDIAIEREFGRASRYKGDLAFLITDVDRFKRFNDTYGHQMGDRVLRLVAEEVRRCVRTVDLPARYGGEEFAIILPETDLVGAQVIAERIRSRIEALAIEHRGETIKITISIGIASTRQSAARSAKQFIEEADSALYRAKDTGRNRVCAFEPEAAPDTKEER